MRAAILARVSTSDQQSIPMQLDEARALCKERNWTVVREASEEISGASQKRPGRDAIMDLARRRKIDVVIVWRLNRFGRSAGEVILLLSELSALGASFVSIKEHLDLSTPVGRMITQILAVFAEFEREILTENVRAGIAAYRAKNDQWGRPAKAQKHKEKARQLKADGRTIEQICYELEISRASVYRLLSN